LPLTKDSELSIEHAAACRERCVSSCNVSPRRADVARGPAVRVRHGSAVPQLMRAPSPLWEHIDDWDALRASGADAPLPETYTAFERADERYNLDKWTRADGIEDRALDALHASLKEDRKQRARSAPDVDAIAVRLATWFPRLRDVREHGDCLIASGGIFVGLAWGLALILFGRERDPLSEYAIGRMLPGEPLRDVRPPFGSAVGVLYASERELPALGIGAGSAWPEFMPDGATPKPQKRMFSKWGEVSCAETRSSAGHARGERAVHHVLDARAVARRVNFAPHERAAVEVITSRKLNRDEKTTQLRAIEAHRRGVLPSSLVTSETARLAELQSAVSTCTATTKHFDERIASRASADADALPQLLRAATADISDAALHRQARACLRRLDGAVARVSTSGDTLAPARTEKPRRAPATPEHGRARMRRFSEVLASE